MEMIREAGFAVWLVLAAGAVSTALAARFAVRARRDGLGLVVACIAATLLVGCLGTAIGVQTTVEYVARAPEAERWLFVVGLRESLHNLVLALGFAIVSTIALAVGLARGPRATKPAPAPGAEPTTR